MIKFINIVITDDIRQIKVKDVLHDLIYNLLFSQ
jgi:hypothetical protein